MMAEGEREKTKLNEYSICFKIHTMPVTLKGIRQYTHRNRFGVCCSLVGWLFVWYIRERVLFRT